jgi:hypothetical protein
MSNCFQGGFYFCSSFNHRMGLDSNADAFRLYAAWMLSLLLILMADAGRCLLHQSQRGLHQRSIILRTYTATQKSALAVDGCQTVSKARNGDLYHGMLYGLHRDLHRKLTVGRKSEPSRAA